MKLSVIIPTYRRFDPLLNTLDDVLTQDYDDFEVIVADQNPEWPRETEARLQQFKNHPRIKWLEIPRPGVIAALHYSVELASGDALLFIDDDVRIPHRSLFARHIFNYSNPTIHGVAGREVYPGEPVPRAPLAEAAGAPDLPRTDWDNLPLIQQAFHFGRNKDYRTRICSMSTCNASVRRDTFLAVGGFDEGFAGNPYGYDYDLAPRMRAAEFNIVYDPEAWLIHLQAPMGGLRITTTTTASSERDIALAPLIFVFRHMRHGSLRILLFEHLLRKTALRKQNVVRPWRQAIVWTGILSALPAAFRAATRGPHSRFRDK